ISHRWEKGKGTPISPQRHKGTKTQRHFGLKRTAAAAAFEIVEVVGEFRPEILVQGIGTEFDESGSWGAELCGRSVQPVADGGFGSDTKNFREALFGQPGEGAKSETGVQVGHRDHAFRLFETRQK